MMQLSPKSIASLYSNVYLISDRKEKIQDIVKPLLLIVHKNPGVDLSEPEQFALNAFVDLLNLAQTHIHIYIKNEASLEGAILECATQGVILFSDDLNWKIMHQEVIFNADIDFKQGKKLFVAKVPSLTKWQAKERSEYKQLIEHIKKTTSLF